jgi:hypothetical protein
MNDSRKPHKPPSVLVLFAVLLLAAGSYALFNALAQAGTSSARLLGAAAWNRATFFREATTYLEGVPRTD